MSIAIFGGSFSPPHVAHEALVNAVDALKCFRKIVVMPCYTSLYEKNLVPFEHRVAMTRLMLEGKDYDFCKFIASDWEKDHQDLKGTIDFMDRIVEDKVFGDHDVFFVMGQDNAENIHQWIRWEELLRKHRFIIVTRGIAPKLDWYLRAPHILMNIEEHWSEISSTAFRLAMANKKELLASKLVKPSVWEYIQTNNLF